MVVAMDPVLDDTPELIELGARVPLRTYIREIRERLDFAVVVPAADLRALNMDTALGQLWHLLNPALLVGVYYLVFGVALKADRGADPYLAFLVVGILMFQLSSRIVQESSTAIPRNIGLLRTLQFPRAILPLSTAVGQTLAFVPSLGVIFVVSVALGAYPTERWFLMVPIFVLHFLFALGGGLVVARIGSQVQDLSQILPHVLRLAFYCSGILYSVDEFVSNEVLREVFVVNPFYAFITATRWSLLGHDMSSWTWASMALWGTVTPIAGLVYFRNAEHRYGS